jgi:hypothetical protein
MFVTQDAFRAEIDFLQEVYWQLTTGSNRSGGSLSVAISTVFTRTAAMMIRHRHAHTHRTVTLDTSTADRFSSHNLNSDELRD